MIAFDAEVFQSSELEARDVQENGHDIPSETTKELYRRENAVLANIPPEASTTPRSYTKPSGKSLVNKLQESSKCKTNSAIPRLKSKPSTTKNTTKSVIYRQGSGSTTCPVNKNTLEMQFLNNKKRLQQLHSELVEKQRPLLDMHKSLQKTKKQLENFGKQVVLEDIKIVTLKSNESKNQDGSGESAAAEATINLKHSIDNALETCASVFKKSLKKRENFVTFLENASKIHILPPDFESEVEELIKQERDDVEKIVDSTIKENEKKIDELLKEWEKSVKNKNFAEDTTNKISNLEETIKQQQKAINDADDNIHNMTRKFEERKSGYEKVISDMQERINKLEEELKKEKKSANDGLMKMRSQRSKVAEMESRTKEAEDKSMEISNKLKLLQEQMRKKEVQWTKEKDEFRKSESLLEQKLSEKQSHFDARCQDMEKLRQTVEIQHENIVKAFETQLELKDEEFIMLQQERNELDDKARNLQERVNDLRRQIEEKNKEIASLNKKLDNIPTVEYKASDDSREEVMEYTKKIAKLEKKILERDEEIEKMQGSLQAYTKLATALKMEKNNAIKYSNKLRDILKEARDEMAHKDKTIYNLHEKLVLRERNCEQLEAELKRYNQNFERDVPKNRCQICLTSLGEDLRESPCSSCFDDEVGKSRRSPRYVSESLIGMSVKKVDHLRARLDNLKKMKFPYSSVDCSWSKEGNLRKQIELRGKLYQILQKHADQSCEDFINLLKLTVSSGGKMMHGELKPSNDELKDAFGGKVPQKLPAYTQFVAEMSAGDVYEKINECVFLDSDDGIL